MPVREILILAFESLRSNKLRSSLTMLGMVIGVGAVVLLVSIGTGARRYVEREFQSLGSNLIIVQPGKTETKTGFGPPIGGSKRKLTLADVQALDKHAVNLDAVSGLMFGNGTLKNSIRSKDITLFGVNEKFPRIISFKIMMGEFFTREEEEFGRRVVVLGYNLARDFFPGESPLGKLVKLNDSEHRVVGVMAKTGDLLGLDMDELAVIPTRSAMRILNDDRLFGIRAKAKTRVGVDDAVLEMKELLKVRHNNQEDFTIVTQITMMGTMNTILGMLTYALGGIAMISMLVGGIGIMNIMLVNVTERTREIGVRRAVGARRADILQQFLFEALVLSLVGGMTGLLGSVVLTYLIHLFTPTFDLRAPLWIFLPAFLMSFLTGILFGVWPARKASRIETIEALRFE